MESHGINIFVGSDSSGMIIATYALVVALLQQMPEEQSRDIFKNAITALEVTAEESNQAERTAALAAVRIVRSSMDPAVSE